MQSVKQILYMLKRIIIKYRFYNSKREWNTWVFGEWFGKKCNDSSLRMANYIATNYKHISIKWIAQKGCIGLENLIPGIEVLEMDSNKALSILRKAGVVFVNEGLQDLSERGYNYCNGAIIVNLWHGIPWKKIGLDSYKQERIYSRLYAKLIFSLQGFSFFPTSSDLCSKSFLSGFALKNESSLIKSGLPRNEIFFNAQEIIKCRNKIITRLSNQIGSIDPSTKIIAYMPTFRDKNKSGFDFSSIKNMYLFNKILNEHKAIIIQKAHIVNEIRNDELEDNERNKVFTWNDCSAQELMAASDMLITDYSSCFFDYLLLDRPIIHYLYDYDYYYGKDRGLYYTKEEVICGDAVENEEELLASIESNLNNPLKDSQLRRKRRQEFLTYESPKSCKIISDFVLNQITNKGV